MFGTQLDLDSFDTPKLEDARNKLRTQIHTARNQSGFNETIENEALTKAQFMHDAIVAELMDRQEHIVDTTQTEAADSLESEVSKIMKQFDEDMLEIGGYGMPDEDKIVELLRQGDVEGAVDIVWSSYADQDNYALASAGFGSDEDYESIEMERVRDPEDWDEGNTEPPNNFAVSINGKRWKVFKGRGQYADDHREQAHYQQLKDWARKKSEATGKKWEVSITGEDPTESINYENKEQTGESMSNLREGEVQQASAIVTAKTMVDRVSRWIEELSGMENDTLLQLGDSIRDEMSADQAKTFISSVAPAIQQALENLKTTRETLSTGVRMLTGEEQGAEMLGGEPEAGGDEMGPAEPDAMNMGDEMGDMGTEDEFAAAEPAAGGLGDAGREQRESINRSSSLLKVLAG